jgi:hypothetical protein
VGSSKHDCVSDTIVGGQLLTVGLLQIWWLIEADMTARERTVTNPVWLITQEVPNTAATAAASTRVRCTWRDASSGVRACVRVRARLKDERCVLPVRVVLWHSSDAPNVKGPCRNTTGREPPA